MTAPLIAIVDNDDAFRALMADALAEEGYRTLLIPGSDSADSLIARARPALVILDLRMERANDGIAVIEALRAHPDTAHVPIILCSADIIYLREHEEALHVAGVETLTKPFDLDALYGCVRALIGSGEEASAGHYCSA